MSPGWALFLEMLGALASVVVILDYFGIKPTAQAWVSIIALRQKWKLVIMLGLVGLTLWFSGYGFYRSLRPKIVEKTVEKPVDRIVEKVVPAQCPAPQSVPPTHQKVTSGSGGRSAITLPLGATINATTNAPNSAAVGINTGTLNVDTRTHIMLTNDQQTAITDRLKEFSGRKCTIMLNNPTQEMGAFGNRLQSAMKSAGIDCELRSGMVMMEGGGVVPSPLFVQVGQTNLDVALALNNVLFLQKVVTSPIQTKTNAEGDTFSITVTAPN